MGILALSPFVYSQAPSESTTVYIVRHAEKDTSDPNNSNPELSKEGRERAMSLSEILKKEKLAVILSTEYKRTIQTGEPLAKNAHLSIEYYNPANPHELAKLVKVKYRGKKVLVIGHTNTVLELAEAFGVARPLLSLTDDDYDFLFKLDINHNGYASLVTTHYGKPHHTSLIKK